MKLLHPTDFSNTAEKARLLALDLRERLGATLDVTFVQERCEVEELEHYRKRLAALTPADGQAHLLWGSPVRKLLEFAPHYDLVVMGAHGANRLDTSFFGGVAGRVMRRSPVPVLTVRDEAEATQVKRLLVATDFGLASKHAWAWCQQLACHGIRLVPAHVIDIVQLQDDTGYTQIVTEAMHNLDRGHRAERHVIRQGDPLVELPRLAQELAADAIVIGLKRHQELVGLLLGSLADGLVRSSPVPVLSVPLAA